MTGLVCDLLLSKCLRPLHCPVLALATLGWFWLDTGKTLTTMQALFDAGVSLLSEDLDILNQRLIIWLNF